MLTRKGVEVASVFGFVIGTVIVLLNVGVVNKAAFSAITHTSDVSGAIMGFEEKKIAGSFRLINRGEDFGTIEQDMNSLKREYSSGDCGWPIEGFRRGDELRYKLAGDGCNDLSTSERAAVKNLVLQAPDNTPIFKMMEVGVKK